MKSTVILCVLLAVPAVAAETSEVRPCPTCPPLVRIPAGSFVMGDDSEPARRPAHRVTLAAPLAVSRSEVTFDQWQECVADDACPGGQDDHGWGRGARPVINVSAPEAERFAAWLSAKSGLACRLPSEAEWEYAARGGAPDRQPGPGQANCRDCSDPPPYGSRPAGSFAANGYGLVDTAGNVWEWTADCWNPSHAGAAADGRARTDGDCRRRVIKGGSWYYFAHQSRPSNRVSDIVGQHSYNIGFRVACDAP
jgi:formylglycine-generating enzyme required for sulfatase activity